MSKIDELRLGFETAYIDGSVVSNNIYRPQFVSNNHKEGKKVLSSIEDELLVCDGFQISVAFITMNGITPLLQTLKELEKRNIKGEILTTNYLNFSEPKALKKLNELSNITLKMYDVQVANEGFHTKGYIFRKEEIYHIIIGSSNITSVALTDAVQILMSRDTIAVAGKNESYMYAGILYCGDCGSSMVHRKESYKGREYINYICSNYNRNGKDACSRHCIREEDLNQIVLGELQGYINSMCDCEKVLAHLDELNVNYDEAVAHDKEIVALKQELTKCSAFKASLYQDLRDEIISKEQFTRYREEFSAKERELEQAIREQETIIRNIYENGIVVAKDLEQFREGLVIGNLDRVALVSFIDRILIYDDFRVEIVFKYRQEMEKVTGLFDVVNEKDAEPVYTMVDGLPVLELKEAV